MKQVLLFLHYWNHFEKFLINRNENETKEENIVLYKKNKNSEISIDHVNNNSNSDRFYHKVR